MAPWSALPTATAPPLRRLLRRCLEKNPEQRLRDIGDARLELSEAASDSEGSGSVVASDPKPHFNPGIASSTAALPTATNAETDQLRHC